MLPALEHAVRSLPENCRGRDFIVGDVHGCISLLEHALNKVNFDDNRDRLLSVGDLIDRGPHSEQILNWLDYPWFFSCLGNHEEILLRFDSKADPLLAEQWSVFGGAWFLELPETKRRILAARIRSAMSYAMETVWQGKLFGVVHADVPEGVSWQEFTGQVASNKDWQRTCLWDRQRGRGLRADRVEGLHRLFSGHHIVMQPRQVANVQMIDTAAYKAEAGLGTLTLAELDGDLHNFSTS